VGRYPAFAEPENLETFNNPKGFYNSVMGAVRFSVTVPEDLMKEFNETISRMGYRKRSKAVQDAIRTFLSEYRWVKGEGLCVGAILVVFNHEVKGSEEELTDLQHSYGRLVNSTLHIHLSHKDCLEIIAVRGEADKVRRLSEKLRTVKGVEIVKFVGISLTEEEVNLESSSKTC